MVRRKTINSFQYKTKPNNHLFDNDIAFSSLFCIAFLQFGTRAVGFTHFTIWFVLCTHLVVVVASADGGVGVFLGALQKRLKCYFQCFICIDQKKTNNFKNTRYLLLSLILKPFIWHTFAAKNKTKTCSEMAISTYKLFYTHSHVHKAPTTIPYNKLIQFNLHSPNNYFDVCFFLFALVFGIAHGYIRLHKRTVICECAHCEWYFQLCAQLFVFTFTASLLYSHIGIVEIVFIRNCFCCIAHENVWKR